MATPVQKTTTHLCAQRAQILDEIATLQTRLAKLDQDLIALGVGPYTDEQGGNPFIVVGPVDGKPGGVTFVLDPKDEATARTLAGDAFAKLFDRQVTHSPCEGFAVVAPKLLTPAKARDLLAICTRIGKGTAGKAAYVRKG